MITLTCYQIRLIRTAIEYFIDAKQDEIEYDWVEGIDDNAIESCKAWIEDAIDTDKVLKEMYREALITVIE